MKNNYKIVSVYDNFGDVQFFRYFLNDREVSFPNCILLTNDEIKRFDEEIEKFGLIEKIKGEMK